MKSDSERAALRKRYPGLYVFDFWLENIDDQLREQPWPEEVREKVAAARALIDEARAIILANPRA